MVANKPIATNVCSSTEIDLKLQRLEQRLDAQVDKLAIEVRGDFAILKLDIDWLKRLSFVIYLIILTILTTVFIVLPIFSVTRHV